MGLRSLADAEEAILGKARKQLSAAETPVARWDRATALRKLDRARLVLDENRHAFFGHRDELSLAYLQFSGAYQRFEQLDKALRCVEVALEGDPSNLSLWERKASLLGVKGDLDGAIAVYDEAFRMDHQAFHLGLAAADLCRDLGKKEEALHRYRDLLAADPARDEGYNQRIESSGIVWSIATGPASP